MPRQTATAAMLITALLAVLLVLYVFTGGSGQRTNPKIRCASAQALDQVKRELFRRAAAIRGSTDLVEVAEHSVVRLGSRVVRSPGKSGSVNCSGTIAVDLPPGVQVIGGRHNVEAKLSYALVPASNGSAQLKTLSNADRIVQPLAAVTRADSAAGAPLAPAAEMNALAEAAAPPAGPPEASVLPYLTPPPPRATTERSATANPKPEPAPPAATERTEAKPPPPPASAPERTTRAEPPPPVRRPPPARTAPVVVAKPSFNCRYARTRGEVAVCRDPSLANLDRTMATQFSRAMGAASPGARVMLERSRRTFLRYRDSCRSDSCIADAYRGRMGEISEIMSGRY